jgi:hypothetical protein
MTQMAIAMLFGNHRRLRELIAELEALSLDIAENDPRWNR